MNIFHVAVCVCSDKRDLNIEVWLSYYKRQTAVYNYGFSLAVCPYLGFKIRGW